jgi:hypothetical protein
MGGCDRIMAGLDRSCWVLRRGSEIAIGMTRARTVEPEAERDLGLQNEVLT